MCCTENPLYARVMITGGLKKNYAEEISLPSATSDGKLYFHQLRVSSCLDSMFCSFLIVTTLRLIG